MSVYRKVLIDITPLQLRKAASGKQITLSASQLKGSGSTLHVHPANYEKIQKAKRANRGVRIYIAKGAIDHDLEQGGSLWSFLKSAGKSVYKFTKDNYDVIKPVLSRIADAAVPALATALGDPTAGIPARSLVRNLTGVGLTKGSPEMKAHMAALRAKRRTGGSVRAGSFKL